jgi:hypothetical protein
MAVFDVDQYETYRSTAEQLASKIESSSLTDDEKDTLAGFVSPVSKTKLRPEDLDSTKSRIPLKQANAIKSKADKFIKQEKEFKESLYKVFEANDLALLDVFVEQSRMMAQLDIPKDEPAAANSAFKLSIACIQFRFDPRMGAVGELPGEKDKGPGKDKKVPDPPLSWMLSPYDKYRIDVAWENQLQRLNGDFSAAAPGRNESDERLLPPERLQQILKFDREVKQP